MTFVVAGVVVLAACAGDDGDDPPGPDPSVAVPSDGLGTGGELTVSAVAEDGAYSEPATVAVDRPEPEPSPTDLDEQDLEVLPPTDAVQERLVVELLVEVRAPVQVEHYAAMEQAHERLIAATPLTLDAPVDLAGGDEETTAAEDPAVSITYSTE